MQDLSESHDRNELLEFQLQESLQRNVDEGNCVSAFKIPTLCVDYQVSVKKRSNYQTIIFMNDNCVNETRVSTNKKAY